MCNPELLREASERPQRNTDTSSSFTRRVGGIDALAGASILNLDSVIHRIIKPPAAWRDTAADSLARLEGITRPLTFYSGTAREAAELFPKNANSTVITALATVGLDRTLVELTADPYIQENVHLLKATGAFGKLEVRIENRPLAANPKSSELTALSLVRLIEARVKTFVC